MPSAGTRYETAVIHGAMDSTYFSQGNAQHPHMIREIARNSNRLYSSGMPIFSCQWNLTGPGPGIMSDFGTYPEWQRLWPAPLPCPHQPQLRLAHVDLWLQVTSGSTVYLQIGTTARPFVSGADLTGTTAFAILGTGAMAEYSFSGLPLGPGPEEFFEFGILCPPPQSLSSTCGTNTGNVESADVDRFHDSAATFDISVRQGRYTAAFLDTDGELITTRRAINLGWLGAIDYSTMMLAPRFAQDEARSIVGQTYQIWDSVQWTFGSIVISEENYLAI